MLNVINFNENLKGESWFCHSLCLFKFTLRTNQAMFIIDLFNNWYNRVWSCGAANGLAVEEKNGSNCSLLKKRT
jgi:hypothetical protein